MSAPAPKTLGELARLVGAELRGGGDERIEGVAPLHEAGPGQITFYTNPSYRRQLGPSRAGAFIVGESDAGLAELAGRTLLVAQAPYAAFAKVSTVFHPPHAYAPGIDPMARVEAGAEVDPTAHVAAFAVIAKGARVEAHAVVLSGAYVGEGARIGPGTLLYPNSVVRERCEVGARCILHPGAVVGADGFGFAFDPEGDGEGPIHRKVPQAGIARLEDDVELGANACVDRGTLGETVVGRGTKIDNLVQIAHNVKIGPLCVIAAQTGIAGSTTVGAGVAMGGQVGIVGHLTIGDFAKFGARAAAVQDVEPAAVVHGHPAIEARRWLKMQVALPKVPDLLREVRELRRRLAALERAAGAGPETQDAKSR